MPPSRAEPPSRAAERGGEAEACGATEACGAVDGPGRFSVGGGADTGPSSTAAFVFVSFARTESAAAVASSSSAPRFIPVLVNVSSLAPSTFKFW